MSQVLDQPAARRRAMPLPIRALVQTKLTLLARRAPLNRTPADIGLDHEDVAFPASDGVDLRGWFIPSGKPGAGPVVFFVHGWLWNRLGNVAGQVPIDDRDVDFLPATRALHDAGYHVLLFDLRNHGESGSDQPVSFGITEARDVVGAVRYLRARDDVDGDRIGGLGCSMGANAIIYGVPECQPVKAVLAIQPSRAWVFTQRFARDQFGPLGPTMTLPMLLVYRLLRAPSPRKHDPAVPARNLGNTLVQYVQGTGDPWSTMELVEDIVAATPNVLPLVRFESEGRYQGYRYVNEEVDEVAAFFGRHL